MMRNATGLRAAVLTLLEYERASECAARAATSAAESLRMAAHLRPRESARCATASAREARQAAVHYRRAGRYADALPK